MCKDKLKSASRQREVAIPEGYDVADEKQEQKEESDILQIISQLPEKYRSAIHLYYYEEYSVKEIAEILREERDYDTVSFETWAGETSEDASSADERR